MFKLLMALCAGLFLTMVIAGRDGGQARMGLTGAYDIADLTPVPEAVETAEAAPETERDPVQTAAVLAQAPHAAATPVSFSPDPDPASTELQSGLTLALPLVAAAAAADPEVVPAQTAAAALTEIAYVVGSNVNVREGPSAKATVVDKLSRGEAVTLLGEGAPGWSIIRIEGDGIEGYIASRYLTASAPETSLFPTGD